MPEGKARQEQLWTPIVLACSVWTQTHPSPSRWSQQRQARLEQSPVISTGVLLTGQAWACSGLCSAVWPAQVFSKAALSQEGFGGLPEPHNTGETWRGWGSPFHDGTGTPWTTSGEGACPPLELEPWMLWRWSQYMSPAAATELTASELQPLGVWGVIRDQLSNFPKHLITQRCELGLQPPGVTLLLKHQCCVCFWLTRDQASPCLVDAGMPALLAGVLVVSSSRHAWKLGCTSASPGNLLWLWLRRMHHFSTTVICHSSFRACMQLRGKRPCTAWALHCWLCLSVSSTAWGVDTEDHHVLVTCALCSADECPVLSPGLCNDLVLRGVDGVGTVLCLALESGEVLSQEF